MTSKHAPARHLTAALLLALACLPGVAGADADAVPGAVRLPESLALTPDGATLVFSWRGDLWQADASGGAARRLTFHPAHDGRPTVSPDGTLVAFSSDRSGTDQVHVLALAGGPPRQVTTHSEGATPLGWFPDGKALLIRAVRDHDWQAPTRFFRAALEGDAAPELLVDAEVSSGAIAPDGHTLAFSAGRSTWWRKGYRGSAAARLWLHDLDTASFRRLTEGDRGEQWPLWGAGGRELFFVSEASGTWNLWSLDLASGVRTQRTSFEDDGVNFPTISADGSTIAFRRLADVYVMDTAPGSQPRRVTLRDAGDPTIDRVQRETLQKADAAAFTDDGREIAIVAGGDLWVMDTELREPRRITNTPQEEREPVFARDFQALYAVSDAGGQPDVWKIVRNDTDRFWWQNDTFRAERITNDPEGESGLTLTPDGHHLAFLKGRGDLWIMGLGGEGARRLVESFAPLEYSFSPDGRWVAYALTDDHFNRDVWIQPVDGSQAAVNVSMHPDVDGEPVWSPDGRLLAFTGRRWSDESDICFVWLRKADGETDRRDRTLQKALEKMAGRRGAAKPKADPAAPAAPPASAADPLVGTWEGLLRGPPPLPEAGLGLRITITRQDGALGASLEIRDQFSGVARGITFAADEGRLSLELDTPLGPLSARARVDGERMEGTWTITVDLGGTFEASRRPPEGEATRAAGVAAPAEPAGARPLEPDLEDIADRVQRVSIPDAREHGLFWSPDSKKLAFEATINGVEGLYTIEFPDALAPKLLAGARGTGARWLKEGNSIAWLAGGVPGVLTAAGKATAYPFAVRREVDLTDRNAAAFEQAWRLMRDTWYDERLGNRDWEAVRLKYLPMASAALTPGELETVVNMMLGELNGSHLGFRASGTGWSRPGWRDVTGHLGVLWDPGHTGPGRRVREVIRGTPADAEQHRLHAGDVVLAVDGEPITASTNLDRLLTGDPARLVALEVRADDGAQRTVRLNPTSYARVRRALYDRWIDGCRARVEETSHGRLGYLHVRSMDIGSFQRFEAELYKVGHGKDGLVIDVRDNGGGFTADHLLTCLTQPRHAITRARGGGPGYPQDRMVYASWHKPIVVLCNQRSFSNAEIFAHAVKTLGRGPIVGVPTAGGVISTGGTSVMGLGFLRLPFRGWFLAGSGEDMERNGCVPDHVVWPEPGDGARGVDRQLDTAVRVLQEQVAAEARRPAPPLRPASSRDR